MNRPERPPGPPGARLRDGPAPMADRRLRPVRVDAAPGQAAARHGALGAHDTASDAPTAPQHRDTPSPPGTRDAVRLALSLQDACGRAGGPGVGEAGQRTLGPAVLVTSAHAGDGKTHVTLALAAGWAATVTGDVLMIEAGATPWRATGGREPALADAAARPETWDLARLAARMRPTDHPRVHRLDLRGLPAGWRDQAEHLAMLLALLRTRHAAVLLDGPVLDDVGVLPRVCDSTLLVIDSGRTEARALQQALQRARVPEGRVAGVVLNRRPAGWRRWFTR